jgi:hypothetical protein
LNREAWDGYNGGPWGKRLDIDETQLDKSFWVCVLFISIQGTVSVSILANVATGLLRIRYVFPSLAPIGTVVSVSAQYTQLSCVLGSIWTQSSHNVRLFVLSLMNVAGVIIHEETTEEGTSRGNVKFRSRLGSHIPLKYSCHPSPAIHRGQTGVYAFEHIGGKTKFTKSAVSLRFDAILRR